MDIDARFKLGFVHLGQISPTSRLPQRLSAFTFTAQLLPFAAQPSLPLFTMFTQSKCSDYAARLFTAILAADTFIAQFVPQQPGRQHGKLLFLSLSAPLQPPTPCSP